MHCIRRVSISAFAGMTLMSALSFPRKRESTLRPYWTASALPDASVILPHCWRISVLTAGGNAT